MRIFSLPEKWKDEAISKKDIHQMTFLKLTHMFFSLLLTFFKKKTVGILVFTYIFISK